MSFLHRFLTIFGSLWGSPWGGRSHSRPLPITMDFKMSTSKIGLFRQRRRCFSVRPLWVASSTRGRIYVACASSGRGWEYVLKKVVLKSAVKSPCCLPAVSLVSFCCLPAVSLLSLCYLPAVSLLSPCCLPVSLLSPCCLPAVFLLSRCCLAAVFLLCFPAVSLLCPCCLSFVSRLLSPCCCLPALSVSYTHLTLPTKA